MKQMEVTKKKIGDATFYIKPFPAFVAANISGELSAVLAPMLGSIAPLIGGDNTDNVMDADMETLLPVVSDALGTISGDKFEHLMKRLLIDYKNISVASEEVTDGDVELMTMDMADEIFCGELQDMLMLCIEVVKLNFGGFFKKIAGQFGSLQEVAEKVKRVSTKNGENSTSADSANSK